MSHQQEIIYAKFVNKVTQRGNAEQAKRRAGQMAKDGAGEVASSTRRLSSRTGTALDTSLRGNPVLLCEQRGINKPPLADLFLGGKCVIPATDKKPRKGSGSCWDPVLRG